jgi:hypothetical protein
MKLFRWTLLLGIAGFLSACGGNDDTLTMTLTPTPAQVASGGTTSLEATFAGDASAVASVEFTQGTTALPTDSTPADGFKVTSTAISAATTFVATAKDESGATLATDDVVVTLSPTNPAQPNAEDKTVTTLAGVSVAGGTTPTGLAVVTEKLVALNGDARLKGTATGGEAVVNPDGTFTFTPAAGATAGSFDYEVVSGALLDTGKVTVTVNALPANTVIVSDLVGLRSATATASTATTIIINGTISCNDDVDCIVLQPGQRLVGAGVIDGVTLGGAAKLDLTSADPETPVPNDNNITGIKLAKGVIVEGLEISGRDIYTAIRGEAVGFLDPGETPNEATQLVTIKNVKIVGPTSNSPIAFSETTQDSIYFMVIDNLTVENASRSATFVDFRELTITNSTFNFNLASGNGLSLISEGMSELTLDKVTVNSSVAAGALSAIRVTQADDNEVMTVTVKDTAVNFTNDTDDTTPFDLAAAVAFNFTYGANVTPAPEDGRLNILTAASTGNTTNATSGDAVQYEVTEDATNPAEPDAVITGYIQGTPATVFETRP